MAVALADEASNGTTIASLQERTPAWKRLGLKLKHAPDTKMVTTSTTTVFSSIPVKRSLPDAHVAPKHQENVNESRLKKRRVDIRTNDSSQSHSKSARTSEALSTDNVTRLGKKVSFTAETKLEDGGKELFNDWERDDFAYYEQKAAENDAKEALKATSDARGQPQEVTARSKRPSDTPRKSKDALDYLTMFHKSPDSWKFNKNREVWILRHILSTEDIPNSFNIALASYVHGLRSHQARSRLLNQCHEALKEKQEDSSRDEHRSDSDAADMDDPNRRKAYHDDAVRRFKRNLEAHLDSEQRKADEDDPEYQHWLSRRRRAEILLWAVTTSSPEGASTTSHEVKPEPNSSASTVSVSGVLQKGHISKKKNRTAVIEASSSSEEDSGSSDTEDDNCGADRKSISNGTSDSTSSADGTSSASSSSGSDSTSDAESGDDVLRRTKSSSSSEHAPGTDANNRSARRTRPLTSTSSASNTSRLSISSATEDTSSAASSTDDDEGDDSSTAGGAQSSSSDESEGSSNGDVEDDG